MIGGAERAHYGVLVTEYCDALGLPRPGIAAAGTLSGHQFEGSVPGGSLGSGTRSINL